MSEEKKLSTSIIPACIIKLFIGVINSVRNEASAFVKASKS